MDHLCRPRITDFGLTRAIDAQLTMTKSSIQGTCPLKWLAPELLHPKRFGFDEVMSAAGEGESEGKKVLANIKKRKDRAKRKRAAAEEAGEESDGDDAKEARGAKAGDAFEDVLYGSESELEDSDEEGGVQAKKGQGQAKGAKGKKEFGARLRGDDEQPMDLLSGAASRVTSTFISIFPHPHYTDKHL